MTNIFFSKDYFSIINTLLVSINYALLINKNSAWSNSSEIGLINRLIALNKLSHHSSRHNGRSMQQSQVLSILQYKENLRILAFGPSITVTTNLQAERKPLVEQTAAKRKGFFETQETLPKKESALFAGVPFFAGKKEQMKDLTNLQLKEQKAEEKTKAYTESSEASQQNQSHPAYFRWTDQTHKKNPAARPKLTIQLVEKDKKVKHPLYRDSDIGLSSTYQLGTDFKGLVGTCLL
jgi:hypothetical protein